MALTFTGTGGLFTRLGKLMQAIRSSCVYVGDAAIGSASPDLDAVGTSFTEVFAQFASNEQDLMADFTAQRDGIRDAQGGWKAYLQQKCIDVLIAQVDRDVTLREKTLAAALENLLIQMNGSGGITNPDQDVDASTVTVTLAAATTVAGASTGNGTLTGSVLRPDGRPNELVFAETIEVVCTSDEQVDGVGRQESWSVLGEPAQAQVLDYRWPDGSGASTSLTTVDPSQSAAGGNLLTNSDFELQTANVPDGWTLAVGIAGTTCTTETGVIYGTHGAKAVKITGNAGGTLTALTQSLTGLLKPNTRYHGNVYVKDSGAGLLAGVITFSLTDGADAVINMDVGTANSSTLAYTVTTASYAAKSFTFVTPKVIPVTGVKLRIAVTTPLTDGESMYLDDLALAEGTEVYPGGPTLALFAGSTNPIRGDAYTALVANNYAGDFQLFFDRLFGMKALGIQLPSDAAAGETLVDTLIG